MHYHNPNPKHYITTDYCLCGGAELGLSGMERSRHFSYFSDPVPGYGLGRPVQAPTYPNSAAYSGRNGCGAGKITLPEEECSSRTTALSIDKLKI